MLTSFTCHFDTIKFMKIGASLLAVLTASILAACGGGNEAGTATSAQDRLLAGRVVSAGSARIETFPGLREQYTVSQSDNGLNVQENANIQNTKSLPLATRLRFADMS